MINVSRLYCGIESPSDRVRFNSESGAVAVYNCTNKCSQNCLHCYSKAGTFGGKELDTEAAKDLLKQLAEIKAAVVLFSGGEPLERADLFELLEYSKNLGLRTVLSTNGNLISSQTAGKLFAAGVKYAGISIDGTQETHDSFRGIKGSFEAALNGIKNCRDNGVKAGLRFTITNRNYNQIGEIFGIAAKNQISRICFYHLISAGRAAENNLKCTNEQTRQVLDNIMKYSQEFAPLGITEVLTVGNHADSGYILNRLKKENSNLYYKSYKLLEKFGGNKIGTKIFAVDAEGNVHPDQFWKQFTMGNIREQKLNEILRNSFKMFNDKTVFAPDRCKRCRWLNICGTNLRDGVLEPKCYLNDEEIKGFRNEFASQNAAV